VKDTGVIAVATATVTLDPPALLVQAVRVVTSDPSGDEGGYLASDADAVASAAAVLNGPGVCKLSADGATLTFVAATIKRAIIQYIPCSNAPLTDAFARS
jgi:hypothetical protein